MVGKKRMSQKKLDGIKFTNPDKIFKRPFLHPSRDIWYWFRYRNSGIKDLDDYFRSLMKIPNKPIYLPSGGQVEYFDKIRWTQIRGSYIPDMCRKALGRRDFRGQQAHTKVEKHFLEMDPATVASEVPVTSEKWKLNGFIDLVRVLDPVEPVYEILDYKPPGTEGSVEQQLKRYQLLLAEILGIEDREQIKLGYFSDAGYYRVKE